MATILIVDDSAVERMAVADVLGRDGHRCVEVEDGSEAIDAAIREQADLIVLDVVMMESNGFQVCRRLRANPETKGIPIVMLSGKLATADRAWGFDQGADAYLGKPFEAEELQGAVESLLHEFDA